MSNEAMKLAFEHWWHHEGSACRPVDEDVEEFAKRMCEIAWSNGAYIERLKSPSDSLLDEAKVLADDRPVEIGHLPQWTLDAEHMIRRLVKAFSSAPQPAQQEPVACFKVEYEYPTPQRTWVGLTDEEMREIYKRTDWDMAGGWEYERAIEAKLKEKNT